MSVNNMTAGSIRRHMLSFALPVFVSQLFQQLYNVADSIIVGRFLPTSAFAAVSSSGNLIFLFTSFFEGVAVGAGVLISKHFGEGDREGVQRSVHTALLGSFLCGLVLMVLGVIFTPHLLVLMNTDSLVLPEATEYFRVYFYGAAGLTVYNGCRGIMMAVGDSRRPLYYLIFSSLLNVALDLLFVGAFRWGVWSAALATSISQLLSALLCVVSLCRRNDEIKVRIKALRLWKQELLSILKYGIPSGIQNSVIGLANVIVLSQINSFGMIATAAYGAYAKTEGFVFIPITSMTMAITTFVSQNLGASKFERAKKGAGFGILSAVCVAAVLGIAFILFRVPIISLFSSDPEVLALSKIQVNTIASFYAFLALAHSIAAVCRGAGRATVPMAIMLGIWCVFRITYILAAMKLFGRIELIYWAYPITWIISDVLFVTYYFRSDWVHGFAK